MRRINEFRKFYNHTIQPELVRMESVRKRLLVLLTISILAMAMIVVLLLYFQATLFTFFLVLPFGFYFSFLLYRIQQFRLKFKPNVVNLILDFVDDSLNYGTLKYDSKQMIDKKRFLASQIFQSKAGQYKGEDYISGKIGELDFELSELSVKEFSRVRSRLNYVFRGIFLYGFLNQKVVAEQVKEMLGEVLILPKEYKQYLSKTIRAINLRGGTLLEKETLEYINDIFIKERQRRKERARLKNQPEELDELEKLAGKDYNVDNLHEEFDEYFIVYGTPDADFRKRLSTIMQYVVLDFRLKTGKGVYISFIRNEIYIAITEPKNILEPYIFRSNVDFELIREFYEEIEILMNILESFDNYQ